jgi:hypothetical protein
MNEILHANIFFIIASVATIIFCILTCIILYYVIKIVQSIRAILKRIEAGSEIVAQDVAYVRELIASGGVLSKIFQFIMGTARGRSSLGSKRKGRSEN